MIFLIFAVAYWFVVAAGAATVLASQGEDDDLYMIAVFSVLWPAMFLITPFVMLGRKLGRKHRAQRVVN